LKTKKEECRKRKEKKRKESKKKIENIIERKEGGSFISRTYCF
jgi:hypothetical protein